ncbi:hypothetical protein [Pseudomonas sp. BR20]|uniref:hypothetical protein n=1 Tax=Pseudomonas sp. BR20 TaxID=3137452 RepID=UPI003D6E9879
MTMTKEEWSAILESDAKLSRSLLNENQIDELLRNVRNYVELLGCSSTIKPKVVIDIDGLQVLNYAQLPSLSKTQIEYVRQSLSDVKARQEDMIFWGLSSLISFSWELPNNIEEARASAIYAAALNTALHQISEIMDYNFWKEDTLLPYWIRLGWLRTTRSIPKEIMRKFGIDRVACIPVKSCVFNASSTVYHDEYYISFNYALEPILKFLNKFLLHYFSTDGSHSGPRRYARAFEEIAPIVLHFNRSTLANTMSAFSILYGNDVVTAVHRLTADQIDFIFMHEIGHLCHKHPQRLASLAGHPDALSTRHKFEYEADSFAAASLKQSGQSPSPIIVIRGNDETAHKESLSQYIGDFNSVQLLFIYMRFIENAGKRLRNHLSDVVDFIPENHSHPSSADRLFALRNIMEIDMNHENLLTQYAESFFDKILSHMDSLEKSTLISFVKRFL